MRQRSPIDGKTPRAGCLRRLGWCRLLPTLSGFPSRAVRPASRRDDRRSGFDSDFPDLHGRGVEAELWRVLSETLLDPECLAAGLQVAREEHERSDGLRRDRLAAIDAEGARQR